MNSPSHLSSVVLLSLGLSAMTNATVTSVDDFGPAWTAISYKNPAAADPYADSNGQQAEELVGNATTAVLFTGLDTSDANPLNHYAYFRTRHAETKVTGNSSNFSSNLIIGIDANNDFQIDAFVGVSTQGTGEDVFIASPDNTNIDNNKTFNSISIDTGSYQKLSATATNYRWAAVTFEDYIGAPVNLSDPDPYNLDIDGLYTADPLANEEDIDYYLSFRVSFSDLATVIKTSTGLIDVDGNTPFSFFVATSTTDNTFNKDIGGLNGRDTTLLNTAFSDLPDIQTVLVTASGEPVLVPEPSSCVLLLGSLLFGLGIRRRK